MRGKQSHLKYGCEATARGVEIGGLTLVYACSGKQTFSSVSVKAKVDLSCGYGAVNLHGSFPRRNELLCDIIAFQSFFENASGQFAAPVHALAAMTSNRLKKQFTPGTP